MSHGEKRLQGGPYILHFPHRTFPISTKSCHESNGNLSVRASSPDPQLFVLFQGVSAMDLPTKWVYHPFFADKLTKFPDENTSIAKNAQVLQRNISCGVSHPFLQQLDNLCWGGGLSFIEEGLKS